jgi:hypothetical protein
MTNSVLPQIKTLTSRSGAANAGRGREKIVRSLSVL